MIENIFEITLSMSVVIIAVLLFSPIIEKRYSAKWRYFIWLFIAIRLIIPFNITLPKAPINIETPSTNVYIGTNVKQETNVNINTDDIATQNITSISPTIAENNSGMEVSLIDVIQNIWILGMILFIGYNLVNYGLFRNHIKKMAKEVEIEIANNIQNELNLKFIPKIVVSNEILSPMLVGFIKPMVILPEIKYSDNELKVILKHEFMHYKRRDLWYKLLLIIANGMHWFNPIVYLMVRKANRDLEYSCDDDVVKNENMEYRKDYSMTILKSMENSRATALSTYLSKSGENEKKRFKNVLDIKTKKKGIFALIGILVLIVVTGSIIVVKHSSNDNIDKRIEFLSESDRKKYYIDFAMDNRIDFIPNFDESTYKADDSVSTEDFLMLTYYMNKDKLPEDLTMSAELVEKVMKEHFGIEKVEHKSQFKGWTYIEAENKYTPYPEGTAEDGLFDVINFNAYKEDSKKIYDVTLREYRFPFIFDKDDSALSNVYSSCTEYIKDGENIYVENVLFLLSEKGEKIKNAEINIYNAMYDLIVEDNTDGFTAGKTIRIKYYIDETTGKPKFIYKNEELSDFIFAEKYDEVVYEKRPDESYSTRFVLVRNGEYWGIVNGWTGKEILKPDSYKLDKIYINTYEEVWPVIEVEKDGKYGMIDYYGNMVIEPKWEKVWMDVYNVPNVVLVYDGEKWGSIKLTFDNYINPYEYAGLKASEVNYVMDLPKELPTVE